MRASQFLRHLTFAAMLIVAAQISPHTLLGQQDGYASASYSKTVQEEDDKTQETDQLALAKTLDGHNGRIKRIEEALAKFADDQKEASFFDQIDENRSGVKDNVNSIGEIDDEMGDLVTSGHGDQSMQLFGRVHTDYWSFPKHNAGINLLEGGDPQDRFGFRRLRIGVQGNVTDNMIYKIAVEFAGGNNTEFRDAYLGFTDLPIFGTMYIGNHKRPYGLDQLNSSRYNVFMERPLGIEAFNQDARRLGISGNRVSKDLCTNVRFGIWEQTKTQNTAKYIGDNYQLEVAGRYARTLWWDKASNGRGYGHVAVSGSYAFPDGLGGASNAARYRTRPEGRSTSQWIDTGVIAGAKETTLVGVEGVLNVGPVQLVGEYQVADVERFGAFGPHVVMHGGYFYASYFLTGEHMPWDRKTGTLGKIVPFENFFSVCDCDGHRQRGMGAWQVAARFSFADLTDDNIIGGEGSSMTLGLNWYWNQYARAQINYIVGDIDRQAAGGGDYQIFGARFMIDF